MPWREVSKVELRKDFAEAVLVDGMPMAEACRLHGISRPTGYKWLRRYEALGRAGLVDRSRAPRVVANRTPEAVEDAVAQLRRRYPSFGPKKLKALLEKRSPGFAWPATSTIGEILERQGLVDPREARRRTPASTAPLSHAGSPNDVWSVDFKGQFALGNGQLCYPFTVTDNASRMLLAVDAYPSTKGEPVRQTMERLFTEHGLPRSIRSDNGAPFASPGILGLSALSAWWLSIGVAHERIEVGHPEQNGRHERMHLTLKQETTRPAAPTLEGQQERFDRFRAFYNTERPHEALGQHPPATAWMPSERPFPAGCEAPDYSRCDLVRQVSRTGALKFRKNELFLSTALAGHTVGITEIDVDVWLVEFAGHELGLFEPWDTRVAPFAVGRRRREEADAAAPEGDVEV